MDAVALTVGYALIWVLLAVGVVTFAGFGLDKLGAAASSSSSDMPSMAHPFMLISVSLGLFALGGFIDSIERNEDTGYVWFLGFSLVSFILSVFLYGRLLGQRRQR